jgi:DNA-binding MarR family transcriptional regulator
MNSPLTTGAPVTSLILSRYLPYQLNNIAKRVSDACSVVYSDEFGLSIGQWRVLAKLGEARDMKAKDVVAQTLMDKSRVSRIVRQLEERGLLIRKRDVDDQRGFNMSLTPAGRDIYAAIVPKALEWETALLEGLDLPEYRDLLRIMEKLDRRLDRMTDSSR